MLFTLITSLHCVRACFPPSRLSYQSPCSTLWQLHGCIYNHDASRKSGIVVVSFPWLSEKTNEDTAGEEQSHCEIGQAFIEQNQWQSKIGKCHLEMWWPSCSCRAPVLLTGTHDRQQGNRCIFPLLPPCATPVSLERHKSCGITNG